MNRRRRTLMVLTLLFISISCNLPLSFPPSNTASPVLPDSFETETPYIPSAVPPTETVYIPPTVTPTVYVPPTVTPTPYIPSAIPPTATLYIASTAIPNTRATPFIMFSAPSPPVLVLPTMNLAVFQLVPELFFLGTEVYEAGGTQYEMYKLQISNWAIFSDDLFDSAPDLLPCGQNTNASRTWVEIRDADNEQYIYGFCAFQSAQNLESLWFAVKVGEQPPNVVYVNLVDRRENITYRSNNLVIP